MIKMYKGQFVFIKDEFLNKYFPPIIDKDNKKNYINHGKGRPFFYVFDETEDIEWVFLSQAIKKASIVINKIITKIKKQLKDQIGSH